ncbi:MAG TPA: alpha/beta hydrolase [Nocardioidaceae bacterium]
MGVRSGEATDLAGLGRVRRHGEGPAVLVLSNPQADPDWWAQPLVSRLVGAGFEAVTFVHTGRGTAPDDVVADVVRLVEHLDVAPVALVGWSQGAAIAQEVALRRPDLVAAAALIATYGRQNAVDRVLQEAWDALASAGESLDPVRLAMLLLTSHPAHLLSDDDFLGPRLDALRAWSAKSAFDPEGRRRSADFIAGYQDRVPALRAVSVPCLVMGFGQDTDTFAARAREVADAIPGSRYVEVAELGHLAPVTHPDVVTGPVLAFLREHVLP